MYQNNNYSNKWFYAFITNMQYENNGTTLISITTDVWQTWQFDITWKQSFIEREMIDVQDDIPGANLIPEGLELGEVKIGGTASVSDLRPIPCIAYSSNNIPQEFGGNIKTFLEGSSINGMVSPVTMIICSSFNDYSILLNCINLAGFRRLCCFSFYCALSCCKRLFY